MLDVNAQVEGEVAKSFQPYDHDVNVTVFSTLCARFNIELSYEAVEGVMKHIEKFQCRD